jgi:hypothetical protein
MGFGFGLLKTYDLFQQAVKENNRLKLWWAFTCASFFRTQTAEKRKTPDFSEV